MKQNFIFKTIEENRSSEELSSVELSRNILEAAKQQAQQIISEAKKEADKIIRLDTASKLLNTIQLRSDSYSQIKKEMFEAVLSICEEVLGTAVKTQPESILNRIERALDKISHINKITLLVNPTDYEFVHSKINELQNNTIEITLVSDSALNPGNTRLESSLGSVVSSVSGHLAAIRLHLTRGLND